LVALPTYSYPWANPDDLLHENFGTTDVSPGTYHLYTHNYVDETACGSTPLYRDLGNHTFAAGKVTYVGLYPSWLPFLRPASGAG